MILIYDPNKIGFRNSVPGMFEDWKNKMGIFGDALDRLGDVFGMTPDQKSEAEFLLSGSPFIGDFMTMRDLYNQMSDYLKNTGMTWSDIMYPARTPYSGIGGYAYHELSFVSSNLGRLYKKR